MRRAGGLACVLAAAAVLGGCLGAKPPIPRGAEVTPPRDWRTPVPADSPALEDGWWRAFGDPVLSAVVERAIANNPQIGEAVARVEQARAQEHLARAERGPDIEFADIGGRARELEVTGPITTTADVAEGTISWDLDLFHRLAAADASARASLLSARASQAAVRLSVAATAAHAYITLLGYDAQLAVVRQTLATRAASLHIAERRASVGYTSRLELEEAQSSYHQAQQLEPQTALAVAEQENALSGLLGDTPHAIARNPGGLYAMAAPGVPGDLPARLLRRRPDVYAAEEQVVSADHSLDSARAAMLPDVSLTGLVEGVFASVLPDPQYMYVIGGQVTAPLFDSGRRKAAADIVLGQRNEAAFTYRQTALTAFQEVENGLSSVHRLAEQDVYLGKEADADASVLHIAERRYRQGYSPYLEQLVAERQLLASRLSAAQTKTDRLNAYVTLYEALGGGWSAPPASRSAALR